MLKARLAAIVIFIILCPVSAEAAECSSYNPEARRLSASHPDDGWAAEKYGRVCTLTDKDHGQADYYTRSKAICESLPGFVEWIKDGGTGYNRCIFDPPESSPAPQNNESGGNASGPNSCAYANDGVCDAPGACADGTDTADCSGASAEPPPESKKPKISNTTWFSNVRVCNKHNERIYVAVAGKRGRNDTAFEVTGWWSPEPGDCANLGSFKKGNFYLFAETKKGMKWKGAKELCVRAKAFHYSAEGGKCSERAESFRETLLRDDETTFSYSRN